MKKIILSVATMLTLGLTSFAQDCSSVKESAALKNNVNCIINTK